MCILRGFLKDKDFRPQHRPTTTFAQNGQNCWVRCGNDAPWALRQNLYGGLSLVPRSLETRTKRGFPHSHSDYDDGTRFGRKANTAKIAGHVGFLHRTEKSNFSTVHEAGTQGHVCENGRLTTGGRTDRSPLCGPNNLGTPSLITYRPALPRVGPLKIISCWANGEAKSPERFRTLNSRMVSKSSLIGKLRFARDSRQKKLRSSQYS